MKRQGEPILSPPYGLPSKYEKDVVRRPTDLTPTNLSSWSFTPLQDLHGIITVIAKSCSRPGERVSASAGLNARLSDVWRVWLIGEEMGKKSEAATQASDIFGVPCRRRRARAPEAAELLGFLRRVPGCLHHLLEPPAI